MAPVLRHGCVSRSAPTVCDRRRRPGVVTRRPGHASVGSTSIRRRSAGLATDARPSPPRRRRPPGPGTVRGPARTSSPGTDRALGDTPRPPGPAPRQCAERRETELTADRLLGGRPASRGRHGRPPAAPRGPGTRVRTSTRPPRPGRRPAAARARSANASSPAPNRRASRCWSNVQEDDQAGVVDPVERRLGPDHEAGRGQVARRPASRPSPRPPVWPAAPPPPRSPVTPRSATP